MEGAYRLTYELVEGNSEQLVAASDLFKFLDLIKTNNYPSPNLDKLKTAIESGIVFKYCQNRFHVEFIPGMLITGTAHCDDRTRMNRKVADFINKNKSHAK